MPTRLPTSEEALRMLRREGRYFPESNRRIAAVPGATYRDRRGVHPVSLDHYALCGTTKVFTNNTAVAAVTNPLGHTGPAAGILPIIRQAQTGGLVWGFSGFAMPGYDYTAEAAGMIELIRALNGTGQTPSLICDGGVSDGVLGLSGALAKHHGIPSLGYAPLEGLACIGPRNTLVAHKDTYRAREILVGITPDILVCVGGGPGSLRECEEAIKSGGIVVLLSLREYDYDLAVVKTYRNSTVLREAAGNGTFIVCGSVPIMRERLSRIMHVARRYSLPSRSERLTKLGRELA